MKKSISKFEVIKALVNEPKLRRGYWFKPSEKDGNIIRKNCAVCAVGSILRAISFEKWGRKRNINLNDLGSCIIDTTNVSGDSFDNIPEHLENKNYLAALSCYFESGKSRLKCVEFVIKEFPAVLTIQEKS